MVVFFPVVTVVSVEIIVGASESGENGKTANARLQAYAADITENQRVSVIIVVQNGVAEHSSQKSQCTNLVVCAADKGKSDFKSALKKQIVRGCRFLLAGFVFGRIIYIEAVIGKSAE